MSKTTAIALIFLVLGLVGWYEYTHWTPQQAEQDEIRTAIEGSLWERGTAQIAADRSKQIYSGMNSGFESAGDVDTGVLRNTLIPRAQKANEIRMAYHEAMATTEGRTRAIPQPTVIPQQAWQYAVSESGQRLEIRGPVLIEAWGSIYSKDYQSGPDGMETPAGIKNCCDFLVPGLPYWSLVGRLERNNGSFTSPFLVGSRRVVCPHEVGDGRLQISRNEVDKYGGYRLASFWGNVAGGFFYRVTQLPATACQPPANQVATN